MQNLAQRAQLKRGIWLSGFGCGQVVQTSVCERERDSVRAYVATFRLAVICMKHVVVCECPVHVCQTRGGRG